MSFITFLEYLVRLVAMKPAPGTSSPECHSASTRYRGDRKHRLNDNAFAFTLPENIIDILWLAEAITYGDVTPLLGRSQRKPSCNMRTMMLFYSDSWKLWRWFGARAKNTAVILFYSDAIQALPSGIMQTSKMVPARRLC